MNHAELFSQLVLIERARPRFEPLIKPHLTATDLTDYHAALDGLLPHLPAQLRMQDDSTRQGLETVQNILSLMAFATGQQWAGMLRPMPLIDHHTGKFSSALEDAATVLGRSDLPQNLRAEWQEWWDGFNAQPPTPDLEF